jgi:hypothetical protein
MLMNYLLLEFGRLKDRTANLHRINCVGLSNRNNSWQPYCLATARDKILISANPCLKAQHSMASMNYFLIMLFRFVNVIDIFKTAPNWFRPSSLWLPNLYDVSHSVETIFTTHFKLPSLYNSWFCKKLLQIKLRTFRNRFRYCPSQIFQIRWHSERRNR